MMLKLVMGLDFLAELWHVSAFGRACSESKSANHPLERNQILVSFNPNGRYLLASAIKLTALILNISPQFHVNLAVPNSSHREIITTPPLIGSFYLLLESHSRIELRQLRRSDSKCIRVLKAWAVLVESRD